MKKVAKLKSVIALLSVALLTVVSCKKDEKLVLLQEETPSGKGLQLMSGNYPTCSFPFSGTLKSWTSVNGLQLALSPTSDKKYYWRGLNNMLNSSGVLNTRFQVTFKNNNNYPATVRVIAVKKSGFTESYTEYSTCYDINTNGSTRSYDFVGASDVYAYDFEIIIPRTGSQTYPNNTRENLNINISVCRSSGGGC